MRITVNGQRADASIKYHIPLRLWCTAKGRAVENSKEGKELNRLLDAISVNITQVRRQLESEGQEISASAVLLRYLGKDAPRRHSLIEVFKEHNEKCRALSGIDFSPTTVQRYDSLLRITQEFLNRQYGKTDFYLDELPERLVEDYEFYMKIQRKCAHNTVMKNLKNFKKIIRIAMTNGWLKKDPFREKHIHMEKVERAFLEKHEFLQVLNKQIDIPRIGQIRDIFCFCCLTGLAFADVQQLKPEHIVKDINGMEWIRKARQKTKNMCNIPLLEEARKILDRYKEHPYCQTHSVLLPVCSAIQATDKDNRYDTQSRTETDTPTKGCLRGHMELRHAPIEVIIAKVQSKDKAMTLSTIHRVLDSFCKAGICRWHAISKRANATTTSRCTNITTCSTEDESWFTTMRSWSA